MTDATQTAPELHRNSTRRRIAPAQPRTERYLNPITALHLRLVYLLNPLRNDTDLAKVFGISRTTVANHTRGRDLRRDRPFVVNVLRLKELWAEEAKAIHLRPEDFVPAYLAVWTRFDPAMMEAVTIAFQRSIALTVELSAI